MLGPHPASHDWVFERRPESTMLPLYGAAPHSNFTGPPDPEWRLQVPESCSRGRLSCGSSHPGSKNQFALTAQTSPRAAFLPVSSLFWLGCQRGSTASARGLSPPRAGAAFHSEFDHPHWVCFPPSCGHMCVFIQASLGQGVLETGPRTQTRTRMFNCWVPSWIR